MYYKNLLWHPIITRKSPIIYSFCEESGCLLQSISQATWLTDPFFSANSSYFILLNRTYVHVSICIRDQLGKLENWDRDKMLRLLVNQLILHRMMLMCQSLVIPALEITQYTVCSVGLIHSRKHFLSYHFSRAIIPMMPQCKFIFSHFELCRFRRGNWYSRLGCFSLIAIALHVSGRATIYSSILCRYLSFIWRSKNANINL